MGNLLYFPDNKLEYIPSLTMFVIITILAFLTVRIFIRISKKQEEKAKVLEKRLMENKTDNYNQES